jgi:hypothetical protein
MFAMGLSQYSADKMLLSEASVSAINDGRAVADRTGHSGIVLGQMVLKHDLH